MSASAGHAIRIGADLVVDFSLRVVSVRGQRIVLGRREFDLLALLARHANVPLRSEWIAQQIWGSASGDSGRLVAVVIHRLRSRIEVDPDRPTYITTVRGYGYRLVDTSQADGSTRSYQEELDELKEIVEALVLSGLSYRERDAVMAAEHARVSLIARRLQRSMLLQPPEDGFPGLTLSTTYAPCWDEAEVGGDFFDAFALEDGAVALVVGDIAGKGLQAAARTLEIKYALRAFLQNGRSLSNAVREVNNFVLRSMTFNGREDQFVALAAAVLDPASGVVEYVTAACAAPLALRAEGTAEALPERPGLLLGVNLDTDYLTSRAELKRGDAILLATDGITEARTGSE
ncbi:MAG: SpoIIE family protein phosphatase, partial [Chloroflexi bacterium]|nr:SpoIIE family protein phosphatase [Chloroflexota bacterium]